MTRLRLLVVTGLVLAFIAPLSAQDKKDPPKALPFGYLLQFRARVRDGEEAKAGFLRTDEPLDAVKEILLEDVRLERRA